MGLDYLGNHMEINVSELLTGEFEIILDLAIKLIYNRCICIHTYTYMQTYIHTPYICIH